MMIVIEIEAIDTYCSTCCPYLIPRDGTLLTGACAVFDAEIAHSTPLKFIRCPACMAAEEKYKCLNKN